MTKNYGIVHVAHAPLRGEPRDSAEMVSQLLFGEGVEIIEKRAPWIHVKCLYDGYEGFMDEKQILHCSHEELLNWFKNATHRLSEFARPFASEQGTYWLYQGALIPEDYINGFKIGDLNLRPKYDSGVLSRNLSSVEIAQSYMNCPYLWGGRSVTGIDCSGLTQMVFAFLGKPIFRDASQQVNLGQEVEFEHVQAGDLAFFHNDSGKVIHVGILTGQGTIIHAHGQVTEDHFKSNGIYKRNSGLKSHNLHTIKRL